MNNPIGTTNSFCGGNNENMLLILVLLLVLCPGYIGSFGCGNDSFIIILFLLILMPSLCNSCRNIC